MRNDRGPSAIVALSQAVASPAVSADSGWRFPTDRITQEQWQTYLDETRALPGVRSYEAASQIIVRIEATILSMFHHSCPPAYPAVVKRHVVRKGTEVFIERKGHYAGDKIAYDHWCANSMRSIRRQKRRSIGK